MEATVNPSILPSKIGGETLMTHAKTNRFTIDNRSRSFATKFNEKGTLISKLQPSARESGISHRASQFSSKHSRILSQNFSTNEP
jgi:hypothetical protein